MDKETKSSKKNNDNPEICFHVQDERVGKKSICFSKLEKIKISLGEEDNAREEPQELH